MAKKTIILVRHGQYHSATELELERLTQLGRKQASLTGKRLKKFKIDQIVQSSMPRAMETANIIIKELGFKRKIETCDELRECVPGFPKNLRKKFGFTDEAKLSESIAQAERAYKKYFKKPTRNSVTVLVCHGNIIRYLVCKILDVDPTKWKNLDMHQCGISIVELESKGTHRKQLISHNDVGHIQIKDRTFI